MSSQSNFAAPSLFGGSRLFIFSLVSLIAVTGARSLPEGRWRLWLSVAAILIAIWHGAFDGVLAEGALKPRFGARWRLPFYAAYLSLGAVVLLLWWSVPIIALSSFLLYSAFHFGTETERDLSPERLITGMAEGFVPIAAACHWWPQQVASIFGLMLRNQAEFASVLTGVGGRSLWPIVVVAGLATLRARGLERFRCWTLIGTELVLFRGCSPVVAFALFFCLWHTPEHMLSTSVDRMGYFQLDQLWKHLRGGFPFWLMSLAGLGLACGLGRHEVQSEVGFIFIALSAFTVPHMALAELCRRQDAAFSQLSEPLLLHSGLPCDDLYRPAPRRA